MECVEGALKTCFRKEMGVKLSPQICFDENGCLNPQNVVSCDDFFVDQLLDLSNEEEFVEQEAVEEEEEEDDDKGSASISVSGLKLHQNASFSAADDFSSLPTSELSVPADDLEDLEWLSHFVEDSFSEFSTSFPSAISLPAPKEVAGARPEDDGSVSPHPQPCFKTPVPVKARSKRTRTGGRVWCLRSPSFTESSSSSTTSSSSSSPPSSWLIHPALDQYEQVFLPEIPPAKKPKKKFTTETARNCGAQPPRRCSHCGVQKTPQWRTGPLGAKTLCNACGVRYKSGRLLPEYRPACSPTFSNELHSNHHRKVLEMRRKNEAPPGVSDSGLAPPAVTSF